MTSSDTDDRRADQHAAIAQWLSTPAAYPHRPASVERIETHISCVYLAGELVYKLKKPVRFDFLDFCTLAAREQACRDEVRLNRRLAPNVYRGVVPVTRQQDGTFALAGDGEVVDWLVEMRRLPGEKMLDTLHRDGRLRSEQIDALSDVLANFYAGQTPCAISPEQYRTLFLTHVRDNRQALAKATHRLPTEVVQKVQGFQLQLLQLQPQLFDERVRAGRIIDGHGDLRPEHICFTDPIAIFDCIEFSDEFRRIDVADELAFFVEECDYLGATWVETQFLQRYAEQNQDCIPPILFDFYKAYRASVRAKVALLRGEQHPEASSEDAAEALTRLRWAERYVEPHLRPLAVAIGGLSGTGKSTLAAAVAEALGACLLRSDVIREDLFGAQPDTWQPGEGIYRPEQRQQVYQEMFRRAAELHQQQVAVVMDATFSSAGNVREAMAVAEHPHAIALCVECQCRPEVARQRIEERLQQGTDASAARPELHEQQQRQWQPWPATLPQCQIDTERPLAEQVAAVLAELAQRWR